MRLVYTSEASADLIRIGDSIELKNPSRAISFVKELEKRCRDIPFMPRAYPLVPRYEASGIRRVVHGNYLIFYRVSVDEVTILHVLEGHQNIEEILFPSGESHDEE